MARHLDPVWNLPSKRKGESRVYVHLKLPRPFARALRQFAAEESLQQNRKISQATILLTLALLGSPRLRELLEQAEQLEGQL